MMKIVVGEGVRVPAKATNHAACWDLFSPVSFTMYHGERRLVKLGIWTEIPEGFSARIKEKSGLALKGIEIHGGVIDSDYRGEWGVILVNNSEGYLSFREGDKLAQFSLVKDISMEIVEVVSLSDTVRGSGGFGSTGR